MNLSDFAEFCLSFGAARCFCCSKKSRASLSESFFMVKGAALFLQQGNSPQGPRSLPHPHKHAGDLPQHLQVMINLLRCEDRIKLAVRLESAWTDRVRYMVVVYSTGRQDTEENILLGVDFSSKESKSCTIGMVLRLWSDTKIHLDGDGGFSVSTAGKIHIFKPVSVQAMWPTERERAELLIKAKLRSIMMSKDLENVTSKEIRNELEKHMSCNLKEFKEFIDNEMLLILGQMDKPSLIFDHLYLGSEWNASNLEELRVSGVDYILNVTREIDNFFPGMFAYHNIRVYDEETTDLLAHWNEAYHFINKAKKNHSKCLVHCKMGVSRSASTVIAYAMKEFGWSLEKAYNYVRQKRSIARPNAGFMGQLLEYQGILDASKQRHNKLWKQQSEDSLPPNSDGSGGPNAYLLDCLEVDPDPPGHSSCADLRANQEAVGFHYCFRRLSDSLPGSRESFFQVEDLERDVLLEEAEAEAAVAADLPFLEFSDKPEGEALKGKEKMENSGLGEKSAKRKPEGGCLKDGAVPRPAGPGGGSPREEKPTERWKRRSSVQQEASGQNCENLNNNNSKRSCPEDFEHDAIFGILNKVKPSYQSCADCMYSSGGAPAEAFGEPCENLPLASPRPSSTVCTQPAFLSHGASAFLEQAFGEAPLKGIPGAKTSSLPSVLAGSDAQSVDTSRPAAGWACAAAEKPRDGPRAPLGALLRPRSPLCERSAILNDGLKEDAAPRRDARQTKDLKYLLFSKDLEKPTTNSYLMQHQESLLQLQKAGLVRKHTKELERLRGLPGEAALQAKEGSGEPPEMTIFEEPQELEGPPGQLPLLGHSPSVPEKAQNDRGKRQKAPPVGGTPQKTSTPVLGKVEHTSSFSKDFLKTICYTPPSSRSSNLTRSSSSDSIHSVRGKPGLVKQRTQEIETRLRLAGLTVSSPLKRSNSLAKLASLNLSSEDLSSDADASVLTDLREARSSEASAHGDLRPSPKNTDASPSPLAKSSRGRLKSTPWTGKS
ncbi:protein phosphatase Slingshot homolog 1 isoform X3 [Varanus komodoensis]|uniref:protein phosphatase Slingshot homolog 1 isoform X3 n=1 Tax=Varanus komodoensis TaxID=61221 RepID=UPI001CF79C2A|nr:protein phosphatase Slingshot homolog 1 isoform X3 [Varanus komodoensis]